MADDNRPLQFGLARLFSGDLDRARDAFVRGLRLCALYVLRRNADEGLAGLAAVAAAEGRDETAASYGALPTPWDIRRPVRQEDR